MDYLINKEEQKVEQHYRVQMNLSLFSFLVFCIKLITFSFTLCLMTVKNNNKKLLWDHSISPTPVAVPHYN